MTIGALMFAEMAEQSGSLRRSAGDRHEVARRVQALAPSLAGITLTARGSSANASAFGRIALGIATRRPVTTEPMSLAAAYGVGQLPTNWLSIVSSQSGRTPEIVEAAHHAKALGASTVALTNDRSSPLAAMADLTLHLAVGSERAVPATKTFTAQLATFLHIAEAYDPHFGFTDDAWDVLADEVDDALTDDAQLATVRDLTSGSTAMFVTGRGFGFAIAREGALKIKEAGRIPCEALSHLEFLHGPIAVTGPDIPTLVVALRGPTEPAAEQVVSELRRRGVPHAVVGNTAGADLVVGPDLPEPLAAIAVAVRLQQLARVAALDRGVDPDRTDDLSKVTLT
ncbi:MAG: SIS domain-containing protein [Ilumatobacteraceae bacterium]